ncbi:N-acetylmuramoyl-L-alanine amidase-like domain-containing protein [Lyngbya confervoides]|uniref:DUF1460 domain-containing protein n=1 Tax=Lyngbya confervoides BDU141951 TaxID=1574623 RepID=A0ABD4T0A9_9CYAN|nr:N-acetylmuramoyl-L-alanine amidase-like domain-containing protein [Lyngbya confervoides]MCM1982053.1 DUF1460 domain-containing protein [Lyngbya confervoides BDU141951]
MLRTISLWGLTAAFSLGVLPISAAHRPRISAGSIARQTPQRSAGIWLPRGMIQSRTAPLASVLTARDRQQFDQIMATAQQQRISAQPYGQILQHFAMQLLGRPYQAGLLDQSSAEPLVVSLTQFDCVLFVETVLALAQSFVSAPARPSAEVFTQAIASHRYRQGQRQGYCSRLHYFSDWIEDNQQRGQVQNLTRQFGGRSHPTPLQFMSRHRQQYPQITDPDLYNCIVQMEDRLASVSRFYIPTPQVRQIEAQLQPGDIIAVATAVPYLDVTHTGLIYTAPTGKPGLIHASPGGSVRLAPDLTRYLQQVDSALGIMVARPVPPSAPRPPHLDP